MVKFRIINNRVSVDKEVTELDKFVIDALGSVEKYVNYVIISGYVSIFFGRARGTEDVDIFVADLQYEQFEKMYNELIVGGYEFIVDSPKELYYNYLKNQLPISFWKRNFPLLRIELKIARLLTQKEALQRRFQAEFAGYRLYFGPVEAQIAYKRYIAKSGKDIEDARHLEIVFDGLDKQEIARYKKLFESEFENGKKAAK